MKIWKWFLAYFRLNMKAVCEMSVDGKDYHDYPDGEIKEPIHFHLYTCERCGKKFYI